ncbi:MAG: septum formation initiator family protein [Bacillota bacterium]
MTVKSATETTRAVAKRRFNPSRLPVVLFLVFLAYLLLMVGAQFSRLGALERGVAQSEQELESIREQNKALWERVRLLQSDAYVESLAREKLGLVKPGEVPVVIQKSEVGSRKPENRR